VSRKVEDILAKKRKKKKEKKKERKKKVSSVLFWPMLHNYTRECILIGSVFRRNYYQCPSEASEERRGGGRGTRGMGSMSPGPGSICTRMRTANNARGKKKKKKRGRKVLHCGPIHERIGNVSGLHLLQR